MADCPVVAAFPGYAGDCHAADPAAMLPCQSESIQIAATLFLFGTRRGAAADMMA